MKTIKSILSNNWIKSSKDDRESMFTFIDDISTLSTEELNSLVVMYLKLANDYLPESFSNELPKKIDSFDELNNFAKKELANFLHLIMLSEYYLDNYFTTNRIRAELGHKEVDNLSEEFGWTKEFVYNVYLEWGASFRKQIIS